MRPGLRLIRNPAPRPGCLVGRAVTRRLVSVNVAEHVTIPRKARKEERKNKQEVMPWNVQEVQTFVLGIKEERLCAPLLLSLMGLRPAEVCGLRWTDVDLEDASITIANTRTMMGNRYVVEKDTKSMAGERALPLPAPVLAALTSFKALQAKEKLALGGLRSLRLRPGARDRCSVHDQATPSTRVPAHGSPWSPSRSGIRRSCVVLHVPGEQRRAGPHPCAAGRTHEREDRKAPASVPADHGELRRAGSRDRLRRLHGEALTCVNSASGVIGGHTPTALPDPGIRIASKGR